MTGIERFRKNIRRGPDSDSTSGAILVRESRRGMRHAPAAPVSEQVENPN